jgi:hypothetical protein
LFLKLRKRLSEAWVAQILLITRVFSEVVESIEKWPYLAVFFAVDRRRRKGGNYSQIVEECSV